MVNVFLGRKTLPLVVCSMFLLASLAAFGIKERNPASGTGAATTEDGLPEHVRLLMQKSTGNLEPNPLVGIAQGFESEYAQTTRKAIENVGGLEKIIKNGDTVLIKPNLGIPVSATTGTTTDYRMVNEIVKIVREYGASRIIIAEASPYGMIFRVTGMSAINGVEFINLNDSGAEDCYYLSPSNSQTGEHFYIPKIYMDADIVIDAAKMKNHFITTVSLSLKNCSIGIPPGPLCGAVGVYQKQNLHDWGIDLSIADVNMIRKPDFSIVDGIIGMEGYGPAAGSPIRSNVIIAGVDPVAVDTVGLTFMGYEVDEAAHVVLSGKIGLGINNLEDIRVAGAELDKIKVAYRR
jgi:uncharacterized protein (DUF362 family)